MTDDNWGKLHNLYTQRDWSTKPSLFAETAINYFPDSGQVLELGAGLGQDSAFFIRRGYTVTATDLNIEKLVANNELQGAQIKEVDLRKPLPFQDEQFDVVYAHLSLHYFNKQTTERIFDDIYRVLKTGGLIAYFTNSTTDPEYGTGKQIEPDFYEIDGVQKRYFNVQTAGEFAHKFQVQLIDADGETYKDADKGVHHLIRFIGIKNS